MPNLSTHYRKITPKPNPHGTPSHIMSYYYQDTEYGYHGDENHEYKLYSDSAEPDHYYKPPKPDYHNDYADCENGGTYTE